MTDKQRHEANRALIAAACVLAVIAGTAALRGPAASASQVFVTPRGQADNVQFTPLAGGVVQITYDLISDDPRAVFSVTLDASDDAGQSWNLRPKTMTGDVGPNVTAGRGKRILWEAGRDVETPRFDQFRFRVNPVAGRALPPPASGARTGRVSIRSTPDAATAMIDGQTRGLTPLTVTDLTAGEHVLAIQKTGYLENRSTITVRADGSDTVTVSLTPMAAPTKPVETAVGGGGSKMKWYLLGGAGAAIAGLVAGTSGGGGGGAVTTSSTTTTIVGPGSTTTTPSTTTTGGTTIFAIRGRVTDGQNGAPIPGAQPTIVGGPQAGTKPGADSNGNYVITGLPAGSYNIEFRAQDYDLSPQQSVTIVNSDVTEDRRMSLTIPRANFSQSPNPCVADGTATSPGLRCTLDGSSSQNRIDTFEWSYQDGNGTGQSHPMSAACRGRNIGINQLEVTLTVRNRAGSDTTTKNVPVNKIAGCF